MISKYFLLITTCLITISLSVSAEQNFRQRVNYTAKAYDVNDVTAEIEFGKSLAARILGKYPLYSDKKIQTYLSTLGSGIASQIGRPELQFHFAILDTNDVNAYACPGGYIFITKGAMKLAKNEAQLAGIISHEIAHVNERHVIKKLKIKGHDSSFASGLAALVGGATSSYRAALSAILDQGYALLFEQGIQKSEEHQSDRLAVETLFSLGYDIKSYYNLISELKSEYGLGRAQVVSRTHPDIDSRLGEINKFMQKNNISMDGNITNENRYNDYVKL